MSTISTIVPKSSSKDFTSRPARLLLLTGRLWFIAATIGQYAFGIYVVLYFGTTAASDRFEIWDKTLFSGIIPGDGLGNVSLVFHILLASVILFGGPLQIMPFIRNRFPRFHRYLGRTYVILAVLISLTGVLMTIKGKAFGTFFVKFATSLSAFYICWFAIMTFINAVKRNIQTHRKWALRLFMIANGVWFIRVWPNAWRFLANDLIGSYPENIVAFLTFILPLQLILLEFYFMALKKNKPSLQWTATITIFVFTLIMMVGIYGTMVSWLSKIQKIY